MKKGIKYFIIMIMFFCFLFCFNLSVDATSISGSWNMTDFSTLEGAGNKNNSAEKTTKSIMGTLVQVIRIVGTGIAIIMITYVAIRYMSAAPNEKAEFKKSAVAFIVGAIVLFAATNILGVIADFATTNISKVS